MAGLTITKVTSKDLIESNIPNQDSLRAKLFNISGGLNASVYDFTTGVGYSMEERRVCGTMRDIWYVYDDNQHKISASSFLKHDKEGNRFSGFTGSTMYDLVVWLAGKKLVRTSQFAEEWGVLYDNGTIIAQNEPLGHNRFYYEAK